jgi:hypothetical protein
MRRMVTACSKCVFIALGGCLVSACTMCCCILTVQEVILNMMEYLGYVTLQNFPRLRHCKLVWLMLFVL